MTAPPDALGWGSMLAVPSLRHLEMLQLLMRTHNLTTTARLMGVSQPAVSRALKEVENQTGFQLFSRNNRHAEPTIEAIALQPEIERLFGDIGSLARKISELRNPGGGSINVASVLSLTATVLPRAMASFRRECPQVHVGLNIHRYMDAISLVRDRVADIGFIYSAGGECSGTQQALTVEGLMETQIVCIFRAGDALACKERIALEDLANRTLILVNPQTVPGLLLRRRISEYAGTIDILSINNAFSAVSLVREGIGVGLADPLLLSSHCGRDVVGRPLDPSVDLTMVTLVGTREGRNSAALGFMRHVRAAAAQEVGELAKLGIDARLTRYPAIKMVD